MVTDSKGELEALRQAMHQDRKEGKRTRGYELLEQIRRKHYRPYPERTPKNLKLANTLKTRIHFRLALYVLAMRHLNDQEPGRSED